MPAIKTIVHPVKDLAQAKTLYAALLGVAPYADEPYYVGFRAGEVELGLDPNGHGKGMTGSVGYWEVDDIDEHLQRLVDAGATVRQPVSDVGGGRRIAMVADADGNVVGLQSG
jgi:predicted enzyme related to lactoylglutathione lyase